MLTPTTHVVVRPRLIDINTDAAVPASLENHPGDAAKGIQRVHQVEADRATRRQRTWSGSCLVVSHQSRSLSNHSSVALTLQLSSSPALTPPSPHAHQHSHKHALAARARRTNSERNNGVNMGVEARTHSHQSPPLPPPSDPPTLPPAHTQTVSHVGSAMELWTQQLSQQQVALTLLTPGSLIVTSGLSLF